MAIELDGGRGIPDLILGLRTDAHLIVVSVEPHGVDRSQIRELRSLTPRERLDLLTADAAGLDRLLRAAGR